MALTLEWQRRIENWRAEIARHCYRKIADLPLSGFATREQLTASEAARRAFRPMPPGTTWGAKWEYGWFRGTVVVPREAAGRRIALALDTGGESLVFVDGREAGARDKQHPTLTLCRKATAGSRYKILVESYAGHGPMVCKAGPVPPDRETVPEPPPKQTVVGSSSFGEWQEEVYQLARDVESLWSLRGALDADSLRVSEIDGGLMDFSTIVDFELDREQMFKTVHDARSRLAPLLACRNGSTAPTLYAFGHGHLDVAWLWPLAETERKAARTLSNQLALAEEYPDFRFMHSQAHLYGMVRNRYPALYERVKKAVKDGAVIAEGGMWVEADTNVTGGESLVRQFLHGMRFFRDELGVESRMLWLPDVFGYSGALPQIMRGCGIRYFSTAKIFWAYNGGERFPYNTFIWQGIDGSEVLTHLCQDYGTRTDPATVIKRWNERVQKQGLSTRLLVFGHGDGGGGPTRDDLEYVRRIHDLEGVPRVRMAHPLEYFKHQEKDAASLPRYVGELYFQAHRGTYTSQARTKRANRKSEIALREAETWAALAQALGLYRLPAAELDRAWKLVLLNQFHDIIPGSSIARVYEENLRDHEQVRKTARAIATDAMAALARGRGGFTVFNSLSWARDALVELPGSYASMTDANGEPLETQKVGGKSWVQVRTPACGWTGIAAKKGSARSAAARPVCTATTRSLENDLVRVRFDATGRIVSILDKPEGREAMAGPGNVFRMYKDVPTDWDAWDIDSTYTAVEVELPEKARIEVLDQGPLVARLRITRRLGASAMSQIVSLRRSSRRLDFRTEIDWQERHKLLKVDFTPDVRASEAVHEIQFGHIRRPTHRSRQFDADRFEVCNHKWTALLEERRGFAVLNDCKYGVSVLGSTISLTLLKAALAPDMRADRGIQTFTYSVLVCPEGQRLEPVIREAYDLNVPAELGPGRAAEARSLLELDSPAVVLETVKPPEGGAKGAVVLRLYEASGSSVRVGLTFGLPVARIVETDMMERPVRAMTARKGSCALRFRPFEVKTLVVTLARGRQ